VIRGGEKEHICIGFGPVTYTGTTHYQNLLFFEFKWSVILLLTRWSIRQRMLIY
jgi:hypothetical protein